MNDEQNSPKLANISQKYNENKRNRRTKEVDLDIVQKRLKTIIDLESLRLLELANTNGLKKDEHTALKSLCELSKDFKEIEIEELEQMTPEELDALIKKNKKLKKKIKPIQE